MNTKFLSKRLLAAATVIFLSFLDCPISGLAASTSVTIGSPVDRFSPAVVTIAAGDQVIWTWVAINHSTTSGTNGAVGNGNVDDNGLPGGLWNSGTITTLPHTFTNTFPSAGTFSYYCQVHWSFGMTGAVIVTSGTITPTVSITNPASGAVFAAPASVTVQASASENGGSVTNVQFLVGSTVLKNVAAAPFSATTNNLAAGSYTLSAIAADNNGVTATNSVSISVVTPVTVALTNSSAFSGANFQFSYPANVGLSYVVQRSANLSPPNWISIVTNVAASNPVVFIDTHATNSPNFYRVGRMPNP